jgi:hypothetical protein
MNKITRRNERKAAQLKKVKEKLYVCGPEKSHKKINLVKSLKNLKKRMLRKDEQRKEMEHS